MPEYPRTQFYVEGPSHRVFHMEGDDLVWHFHRSMRAARPVIKRLAQALADSTGVRVQAVREDSTGFTRIYTPTP